YEMAELQIRRVGWPALAGAGLGLVLACTPTLDFFQCRNDDDCRNVAMQELVCVANACVAPVDPADTPCETTADCVARFDEDHICGVNSVCAALGSELCPAFVRPE